jgi:hypothetical protein
MTRIFPPEFTPSDITSMLALLDATVPYIDIEMGRAYFQLARPGTGSPFPDIFVTLEFGENELFARRAAAEAIAVFSYLHAWVVNQPEGPLDESDEYCVSHLNVDNQEIDVCYIGSVNATWHNAFRKDESGHWRPLGCDSAVVKMPNRS